MLGFTSAFCILRVCQKDLTLLEIRIATSSFLPAQCVYQAPAMLLLPILTCARKRGRYNVGTRFCLSR